MSLRINNRTLWRSDIGKNTNREKGQTQKQHDIYIFLLPGRIARDIKRSE